MADAPAWPSTEALLTRERVQGLLSFGHSFSTGQGVPAGWGPIDVMARILAAALTNQAVSGSMVCADEASGAPGGLGRLLQAFTPTRTAAPYLPSCQVAVLYWGRNDVANAAAYPQAWTEATRSTIARVRAARVIEDTDPLITYTAHASTPTGQMNSGATLTYLTAGGSFSCLVPADFEGGAFTARVAAANAADGQSINWTVNGAAAGTTRFASATHLLNNFNSYAKRFRNPNPGDVISGALIGGASMYVDCFEIEATPPPLIIMPTVSYHPELNQANVDAYNAMLRSVAAEFDSAVTVVDITNFFTGRPERSNADGVHPSERGARHLGAILAAAAATAMPPIGADNAGTIAVPALVEPLRIIGTPGNPPFLNGWTPFGSSAVGFAKDPGGSIHLQGRLSGAPASAAAFILPPGYLPSSPPAYFPSVSSGYITIDATGAVTPSLPGASAQTLDGITFRAA